METLRTDMDLSECSVEDAWIMLRYKRPHITVSRFGQMEAKRIADLNCFSWSVSEDYGEYEWSVTINGQTVGSPGA